MTIQPIIAPLPRVLDMHGEPLGTTSAEVLVGTVVDVYRLEFLISENVFLVRAVDCADPRVAVVKCLCASDATEDKVEMFKRDARISSLLDSPLITKFVGETQMKDGTGREYLFSMFEYFESRSLLRVLKDRPLRSDQLAPGRLLPVADSVRLALQVCDALTYVHSARDPVTGAHLDLVHDDISPGNILVSPLGTVKLADFGIARALNWSGGPSMIGAQRRGEIVGTLAYMSPEQARGGDVDRATDIYSLGAVMYEMLTGTPLIRSSAELRRAISALRRGGVARGRLSQVPECLREIVGRALAPDPRLRFQDAEDMAKELRSSAGVYEPSRGTVPIAHPQARGRQVTSLRYDVSRLTAPTAHSAECLNMPTPVTHESTAVLEGFAIRHNSPKDRLKLALLLACPLLCTLTALDVLCQITPWGTWLRHWIWAPVVTVLSDPPGAASSIDGSHQGPTPRRLSLRTGRHTVQLRLQGYEDLTGQIVVTPKDSMRVVFSLTPRRDSTR